MLFDNLHYCYCCVVDAVFFDAHNQNLNLRKRKNVMMIERALVHYEFVKPSRRKLKAGPVSGAVAVVEVSLLQVEQTCFVVDEMHEGPGNGLLIFRSQNVTVCQERRQNLGG